MAQKKKQEQEAIEKEQVENTETKVEEKSPEQVLKEENEALKDQYLRQLAEYDNFKKRTAREKETLYGDAKANCVLGFLAVLDNFERAFENAEETEFSKGMKMIYTQFVDTIKAMGVEEIEAQGTEFNPNLHNAVMQVEDDNIPSGQVCQVFQKGYKMGERVVRHAMVSVAK